MQNNSSSVSSGNSEPLLGSLNTELEKLAKKLMETHIWHL